MGHEVTQVAQRVVRTPGKYQDYLYLHGLGVESAEALAEYVPQATAGASGASAATIRREVQKLFKGHYRGCRYCVRLPGVPEPRGPGASCSR